MVHINRAYDGGGNKRVPVGNTHSINTVYQGKNKWLSYLSGTLDGYLLIRKARKVATGPIVVMTSPPLLPMWASLLLRKREWMLWTMDLFPEGFVATNIISANNPLYKLAIKLSYKNAPSKIISLGPYQGDVVARKFGIYVEKVVLPCGVFVSENKHEKSPAWKESDEKVYFGYLGNCGIPHSADFVKAAIDAINPKTQHLILAVYGTKSSEIMAYAQGKEGVTLMKSVPREELGSIDVHLVTLLDSWTHIAVPSKAVSSICSGSTILFHGNSQSDTWAMLGEAGWIVENGANLFESVKSRMSAITLEEVKKKRAIASTIAANLSKRIIESYESIAGWAK